MQTFLQVLGLIFLIGLVLVLGLGVYLGLKVRAMVRNVKDAIEKLPGMAGMTPPRIHLLPLASPAWTDDATVEALARPLSGLGFHLAGTYQVKEVPGLGLQAWVKPEEASTAVVYEHPQAGVWADFFTHFEDGTRITYANSRQVSGLEHAPGHTLERFPGLAVDELYRRFLKARPDRPARTITAEEFPSVFEKAYADEMDWRNSRGGPSPEEFRAIAALTGHADSDESFEEAHELSRRNAFANLQVGLRERFLEQSGVSAAEWERIRDRLVFIHDGFDGETLDDVVSEWLVEDEAAPSEDLDGSARAAFDEFNRARPPERRFRKLGELREPVAADVYCAPEE